MSALPESQVRHDVLRWLFASTILFSAFLLFAVQPMFAKMALPVLGGSPAVWSVSMVFFQGALLAGYAYAHALSRLMPQRAAMAVHLAVMGLALLCLPLGLARSWGDPPAEGQALWLLSLMMVSIGLPFFAVSANGPLLQAWFARTPHPDARDPYFLYAASNVGSFGALLAYPFLIEPGLGLSVQSKLWTAGFLALGVGIILCGFAVPAGAGSQRSAVVSDSPGWRRRWVWIVLAFVPSGLLVAVTAHISTDVAAAPLIWVIPLALYLLTFVIAFRPESRTPCSLEWLLLAIVAILPLAMVPLVGLPVVLSLNLLAYVLAAYICHQRLYALRPAADRLTEFYLFVSLGGVAGGVFSGLIAPHIFVTVLEYPLLLAAALYCLPGVWRSSNLRRMMAPLAAVVLMALLIRVLAWVLPHVVSAWLATFYLGVAFLCFAIIQRNRSALVLFVSVWIIATNVLIFYTPGTTAWRSFFGVHYVVAENGFHKLVHGNTVHGVMRVTGPTGERLTGRPEPLAYYSYDGAFVAAIEAARGMQASPLSVAVIGLGSGTLACHAKDSERWRFFEIDQRVIDTARDRRYFRFLEDCLPDVPVVLGDARLTVAKDPQRYDLIIVDAFLSDSIPLHLVTVEAVREYQTRLLPGGDLVFHISNRNLELEHVLARVAADAGLQAMVREDPPRADGFETKVLVMTEPDGPAVAPLEQRGYKVVTPDMSRSPWTDDYASILEAIRDKWAEGNKAR